MLEKSIIRVKEISQKYKNQKKLQELRSNQHLIDKRKIMTVRIIA
jgi:hypothetical protein